ncbi:hypothetical protein JCM11251_005201 [Rhodosporidiobolus azoricus]
MTATRRQSTAAAAGGGHQATSLMLDTYEAFKRKHLAQNKEIIHKNSELHKANADLQRQISLMRAERLSLKGSQYQLECENAALRDRAERAEERERELKEERERIRRKGGGMDPEAAETMRQALANAIAALQAFGLMLPSSSPSSSSTSTHSTPCSPSPAPSSSSSTGAATSTTSNPPLSLSERKSLAAKAGRASIAAHPDLSNISEGEDAVTEEEEESRFEGRVLHDFDPPLQQPHPAHPTSTSFSAHTTRRSPSPTPPPPSPPPKLAPAPLTSSTLSRPPRAPKAPPKARSAASHETFSSVEAGAEKKARPARRVSGMVRPIHDVASGGEVFEAPREEDVEAEAEEVAEEPVVARSSTRMRVRRSSLPPPPQGPEPEPEAEEATIGQAADDDDEDEYAPPRKVLKITQPRAAAEDGVVVKKPRTSSATGRSGRRSAALEPPRLGALSLDEPEVHVPPQEDEEGVTPAPAPAPSSPAKARRKALVEAKKEAVRRRVRGETPEVELEVVVPVEEAKKKLGRVRKEVEEVQAVEDEETEERPDSQGSSTAATAEEESGGRRARKSVNYALPKLNTKMRRPEGYVPVTSHAPSAHSSSKPAPRKSTKTPSDNGAPRSSSSCSSTSTAAHPPLSSSLSSSTSAAPPRPASLAGKKPPPPYASAPAAVPPKPVQTAPRTRHPLSTDDDASSDQEDEYVEPLPPARRERRKVASSSSDEDDEEEDDWDERKFLRKSIVPSASGAATSRAGQELEDRRRARKEQLMSTSMAGKGVRRHSVAV